MSALSVFLQAAQSAPFRFGGIGGNDCAMMVADWISEQRGVDLAAEFRGTYASEAEFAALVGREGGLVPLFDRLARAVNIVRTTAPALGDVGVVTRRIGVAGAIKCTGRKWAVRTPSGIAIGPWPMVAAWKVTP